MKTMNNITEILDKDKNVSTQQSVTKLAIQAAVHAAGKVTAESTSLISYQANNHVLVIGNDERINTVISRLSTTITLTVLVNDVGAGFDIKSLPENISSAYGILSNLSGHLGEFVAEVKVKDKIVNLAKTFHPDTVSFDMAIDLSARPYFTTSLLPFGYYSPRNDKELSEALDTIPEMTGEFEKPKFFEYNSAICAHSNSSLIACQRCIEACPANAIKSIKDMVEVDPYLCQGGGTCATVCPSGAMQYVYPRLQDTLEKLRAMLKAFYSADGVNAAIAFYGDLESPVADAAIAADFIPFKVEESASVGMDVWLSALAYGAKEVLILTHEDAPKESIDAIDTQLKYARGILAGMGFDGAVLHRKTIGENKQLSSKINSDSYSLVKSGAFIALNDKRKAIRMAVDHLYSFSPKPQNIAALPVGSPFGEIQVNKENCTLCMACVSVCPASALADGDDLPQLRFFESNCVQCGLCSKACPEMALTLLPQYNYEDAMKRTQRLLHEEEPFCCTACGKPFATHSAIQNITAKLSGHSMFQTAESINRLKMCEDCRVRDMFSKEM